ALIVLGVFISSLTDNQGFVAGIGIAVILFYYYSVQLAEYISSSALGTLVALWVIAIALGLVICFVTGQENLAFVIMGVLMVAAFVVYQVDATLLEGLLPNIMTQLSLFERFYVFVN